MGDNTASLRESGDCAGKCTSAVTSVLISDVSTEVRAARAVRAVRAVSAVRAVRAVRAVLSDIKS